MTNYEHFMLAVCFGTSLGWMLSSIIYTIQLMIRDFRDKKKIQKEKR